MYEAFDLSKFRSWAGEMNLSPYSPSIWVRDLLTGLSSGYWLTEEQASLVSQLVAGQAVKIDLAPDLRAKLFAAGIVVSREKFDAENENRNADIASARTEFSESGYTVLRNVIPRTQIASLQDYYRNFEAQGFMTLGDGLVPLRFVAPVEPLAGTIHRDLALLMSRLVGREIKPSYCYASSYLGGADLPPHTDRPQCEFSFSVQVDYQPEPEDKVSPWPLRLSVGGQQRDIHLANGDLLAYKGCELMHSRPRLPDDHRSTSLFLHYVPAEFAGSLI